MIKDSVLIKSINNLDSSSRNKYFLYLFGQVALSLLDLFGLVCIGTLAALSVSGVQSELPGSRVSRIVEFLGLEGLTFQNKVAGLAIMAMTSLIIRTLLSILITRKGMSFLSFLGARMARDLVARYSLQDRTGLLRFSEQEFLMASTRGIYALSVGILSSSIVIVSDASLFVVLMSALFFVDKNLAIVSLLFFGGLGAILYFSLSRRSKSLGKREIDLYASSSQKISEGLRGYREILVRNAQDWQSQRFYSQRFELAKVQASTTFTPLISKYALEISVVIGAVLFGAYQLLLKDASAAIASLSVFLAAGIRIAPAVMRIQQSALQIKNSSGVAASALNLIEELSAIQTNVKLKPSDETFEGKITLNEVNFTYPLSSEPAIKNATLAIQPGEKIGVIGVSGSGKSTLVDLVLGVLTPSSGRIEVSGKTPVHANWNWPGAIGYVPQEVFILNATILENIVFGFQNDLTNNSGRQRDYVLGILNELKLDSWINSLEKGLDTKIGENDMGLSGGQKQRIGIARALYTKPQILVLDEFTSALDRETANEVVKLIEESSTQTTILMISHDTELMKNFDNVIEISGGSLKEIKRKI
jgi:ABC-type multidrug transport system fused ATPase/permease subunit